MTELVEALRIAATFHDLDEPKRNSDGDTMREAADELTRLRAIEKAARELIDASEDWGDVCSEMEALRAALATSAQP